MNSALPYHTLAVCSSIDPSVVFNTVSENSIAVVGAAAADVSHSLVAARPVATRIMMNNCAMPWFNKRPSISDVGDLGSACLPAVEQ